MNNGQHLLGSPLNAGIRFKQPSIAHAHLADKLFQPGKICPNGFGPAGSAQLFLHLHQGRFAMLDGIPYSLAGYAIIFGNFGQRKVIVIIFCQNIALFFRQDHAVIIQQDGKPKVLTCFGCHGRAPFVLSVPLTAVKCFSLQLLNYNTLRSYCQGPKVRYPAVFCVFFSFLCPPSIFAVKTAAKYVFFMYKAAPDML